MKIKVKKINILSTFLLLFAALMLLLPSHSVAHSGGGDDGGGTGGGPMQDVYDNPGRTPGRRPPGGTGGRPGNFTPPGFMPPPPPEGVYVEIIPSLPIRIEPVDFHGRLVEPIRTVIPPSIVIGANQGLVITTYRNVLKIVYNEDMGWVGISERLGQFVELPMTPFIQGLIINALKGAENR